ncbi:MAG: mechanosensitive ion channel [Saprospiraceae bacterium]|nr:mechanosensitive ion channel [Saprospiraceae bacterium]
MTIINGIPFSTLFVLALVGVNIFIGFNLYRRLILPILLLKESGRTHQKQVDRAEIIVWAIYIIAAIYFALIASLPVAFILIALMVFSFFDFWRNFFSGIILKLGDKLQLGDSISVNGHTGKIIEFGNRALKITSSFGEEVLIPYSLINTEIKIEQKSRPKILLKTFVLEEVSANKNKIETAIYNNPWILISSPISISMENQQTRLSFYVLDNAFFEKAKQQLLTDLGE